MSGLNASWSMLDHSGRVCKGCSTYLMRTNASLSHRTLSSFGSSIVIETRQISSCAGARGEDAQLVSWAYLWEKGDVTPKEADYMCHRPLFLIFFRFFTNFPAIVFDDILKW